MALKLVTQIHLSTEIETGVADLPVKERQNSDGIFDTELSVPPFP